MAQRRLRCASSETILRDCALPECQWFVLPRSLVSCLNSAGIRGIELIRGGGGLGGGGKSLASSSSLATAWTAILGMDRPQHCGGRDCPVRSASVTIC